MNSMGLQQSGSDESSANQLPFPTLWVVGILRLLSVAAFSFACFLAWSAYQAGDIAGCSGGGVWDCSHVLHSKWAKWLTIPVSIPAAAVYATMFISLLFVGDGVPSKVRRLAWGIVTTLAIAAALSALWFIYVQVFELKHLCKYCLIVHGCGLAIALLTISTTPFIWKDTGRMSALATVATAILVFGQVFGKAPVTFAIEEHEAVNADSAMANFESPTMDDEFAAPADDLFENEDVFTAPDSDPVSDGNGVFEVPAADTETRPVSTTRAEELPNEGASRNLMRNSASPFASSTNPLRPQTPTPSLTPPPSSTTPNPVTNGKVVPTTALIAESHASPVQNAGGDPTDRPVARTVNAEEPVAPAKRLIRYPGADVKLNVAQWPILGSDQAPHIVVELFDYTCPYCRTMHQHIDVARRQFGDQIAFIVMPVPLSRECNPTIENTSPEHVDACEIARLALGVWRCNPDAFAGYHGWLLGVDRPRTAAEARQHAETLVDPTALKQALANPVLSKFLARHVALYKRAGEGTLPALLTERVTVRGKMDSAETLCRTLQEKLNLN